VQISQKYHGIELFFKGKTGELSSCPVDHGTLPVHSGFTMVASREAHRSAACRCCRAWERAAGGAKGGGHSGDPYRLHKQVVEGRRWAGCEVELAAVVAIGVERLGA
jgi:hypothetical protein